MEPELRVLSAAQLLNLYDNELISTFPAAELMPFDTIMHLADRGLYDLEGLYEGDTLLGYALLCVDSARDYALIDYLGVLTGLRSGGMGTRLLELVKKHCSGYRGILAEVEAPAGHSTLEDTVIMRRLGFYKRGGFVRLPYDMSLFGVRYRTLVCPTAAALPATGALEAHQRLYHGQFSQRCYERYVQLPLGNEKLRPFSPWAEA